MYCKDCKWFDCYTKEDIEKYKTEYNCEFNNGDGICSSSKSMMYGNLTTEDFGCIHFEAKEGE